MIDAFERNVKKKNIEKVESFEIMNVDEKKIRKSDENETIVMKNAFEKLLETTGGGKIKINSPGRSHRKRIGTLETLGKESDQGTIKEWLKKFEKK